MSEPTKARRTELVELCFLVPAEQAEAARRAMADFAVPGRPAEEAGSAPWRQVYPDFGPPAALRGARKREGLTQKELADRLGIRQAHLSQMETNKRPIGKAMAKRFAEVLGVDYRVFL
jgi:ribosome-binding protein aMBF1 (putative translation factor)